MKVSGITTYTAILANIISRLRKESDKSQEQIAEELGLTKSSWSRIERGVAVLNTEQIFATAIALKTNSQQLMAQVENIKKRLEDDKQIFVVPKKYADEFKAIINPENNGDKESELNDFLEDLPEKEKKIFQALLDTNGTNKPSQPVDDPDELGKFIIGAAIIGLILAALSSR